VSLFWRIQPGKKRKEVRMQGTNKYKKRTHFLASKGEMNMSAHGKYMGVQVTDELESASGGTSKNIEKKRASERGALTDWKAQREGKVRTGKKSERERGTHGLGSAQGGT